MKGSFPVLVPEGPEGLILVLTISNNSQCYTPRADCHHDCRLFHETEVTIYTMQLWLCKALRGIIYTMVWLYGNVYNSGMIPMIMINGNDNIDVLNYLSTEKFLSMHINRFN